MPTPAVTQNDVDFLRTLAAMGIGEVQARDLALRLQAFVDQQQERS